MQTSSLDQLARQIVGNYRIERLLGRGRLNDIYLARNLAEEQRLDALTVYRVPRHFSSEARARFLLRFRREASLITSLEHPHVLPVYDHGEVAGNPYIVTPYMMHGSLADLLKRHGKYDYSSILPILEQLVSSLVYAHSKRLIHGTLRPSTIVLSQENALQVAGFGLRQMLQLAGVDPNEQLNTPYAHLLSIAGTFLVTPEYVAPEVVQGQSADRRSDIYALGCILFELLSGHPPFTGKDPLDVFNKHVRGVIPLLHVRNPDVPITLTSVVNKALERDPARRFQHALELIQAFRQASREVVNYPGAETIRKTKTLQPSELLQDDAPRDVSSSNKWQLVPPIVTGKYSTVRISERTFIEEMPTQSINTGHWRVVHSTSIEQSPVIPNDKVLSSSTLSSQEAKASMGLKKKGVNEDPTQPIKPEKKGVSEDPTQPIRLEKKGVNEGPTQSLESEKKILREAPTQSISAVSHVVQPSTVGLSTMKKSSKVPSLPISDSQQADPPVASKEQSFEASRDKDLSSLANAYSWWSLSGITSPPPKPQTEQTSLASPKVPRESLRLADLGTAEWQEDVSGPQTLSPQFAPASDIPSRKKTNRRRVVAMLATSSVAMAVGVVAFNSGMVQYASSAMSNRLHKQPNTTEMPQQGIKSQINAPGDFPARGHIGVVIGQTTQLTNSASSFKNPADGQESLLIHLDDKNNTFVAYERACTHSQVLVNYDPATKLLVCPAHGAIFDPANGGRVKQGPATKPLPSVKISVNSDGTITA